MNRSSYIRSFNRNYKNKYPHSTNPYLSLSCNNLSPVADIPQFSYENPAPIPDLGYGPVLNEDSFFPETSIMPIYSSYSRMFSTPSGRRATYDVSLIHSYSPFDDSMDPMNTRNQRINSEPAVPIHYSDRNTMHYGDPPFPIAINYSRPRGFAIDQNIGEEFFEDPSEVYSVPLYSDYSSGDNYLHERSRSLSSNVHSSEYGADYYSAHESSPFSYHPNSFHSNRKSNYLSNLSKGSRGVSKLDSKKQTSFTETPVLESPDAIDPV